MIMLINRHEGVIDLSENVGTGQDFLQKDVP
jgi:hypothetical protein